MVLKFKLKSMLFAFKLALSRFLIFKLATGLISIEKSLSAEIGQAADF